jgi:hypothetical protein
MVNIDVRLIEAVVRRRRDLVLIHHRAGTCARAAE